MGIKQRVDFMDTLFLDRFGYFIIFFPPKKGMKINSMAQDAYLPIEVCRELIKKEDRSNIMLDLVLARNKNGLDEEDEAYLEEYRDEIENFDIRL